MKVFMFIILLLTSACTNSSVKIIENKDLKLSENMSFNEFKIKVEQYAEESSYPSLEN